MQISLPPPPKRDGFCWPLTPTTAAAPRPRAAPRRAEIQEQRVWDISSRERFELLQRFSSYGLEHWGSDSRGVESTRRFLLEWMSFSHRWGAAVGTHKHPRGRRRAGCWADQLALQAQTAAPRPASKYGGALARGAIPVASGGGPAASMVCPNTRR
jgi:tRNA-dihydrouridine synthase 3